MALLRLEDVTPGMELAGAIENMQGRVLVNAGVVLTEGMLDALSNWGITEVEVFSPAGEKGSGQSEAEACSGAHDVMSVEELKRRFQMNDMEDAVIKELYRLAQSISQN